MQRQVWVISIAVNDKFRCAGKTLRSLENTCNTWALLRWCFTTRKRYQVCVPLPFAPLLRRLSLAEEPRVDWVQTRQSLRTNACTGQYRRTLQTSCIVVGRLKWPDSVFALFQSMQSCQHACTYVSRSTSGARWKRTRRSGDALAMRHRQCSGHSTDGLTALEREMSTPPSLHWSTVHL